MGSMEKHLVVKTSTIPGAGKGLFTKKSITKGATIVEYKGKVTTWKDADHVDGQNGYIYYIKRNYVIDALNDKKAIARYANDARGLQKIKGVVNNSEYVEQGLRAFIVAKKDIPAGGEIFVGYGKEYWDVIRENIKIEKENQKEEAQKKKKRAAKEKKRSTKKKTAKKK